MNNYRKYVAEAVGTFALVFVGAGSICAEYYLKSTGGSGIGLLGVSMAFGLVVMAVVYALGYISGSHINPAVSVAFWVTKRMDTNMAVFYIVSQLVGAAVAGFALKEVYPQAVADVHLGTTSLGQGVPLVNGMLMEFVITFLLVLTVFLTAVDRRANKAFAGICIGLAMSFGVLIGGAITGGSMNPARTFGPALASGFFKDHFVYWVAPILGAVVAALFYEWVLAESEGEITSGGETASRRMRR
ncbi:MAG TPA: MIP/aquaporin family protein [Candidatus Hypogeohydataceae bacterium YC41]